MGCLNDAGLQKPFLSGKTLTTAYLIHQLYYGVFDQITGGALHIVTDDYNVDNEDLDFCANWIGSENDLDLQQYEGNKEELVKLERLILEQLKVMTIEERLSAIEIGHRLYGLTR